MLACIKGEKKTEKPYGLVIERVDNYLLPDTKHLIQII